MRRGPGIGGLKKIDREHYNRLRTKIDEDDTTTINTQLEDFQSTLQRFASKYREKINKDPIFRAQFQDMCSKLGVDPLSSQKSYWTKMLGVGDFYYELAVQAVNICAQTRPENGGMISLQELTSKLQQYRSQLERKSTMKSSLNRQADATQTQKISSDDVLRAVRELSVLGAGYQVVNVGQSQMIFSVPMEMNNDHVILVSKAQDGMPQLPKGAISSEAIMQNLKWTLSRTNRAIDSLLDEGVIWVDNQDVSNKPIYYFPSLM